MDFPREETLRWIVSRYAGLQARHGEGIGSPDLVQPDGDYFPDEFAPTGEGVARLVARMLEYAPVRAGLDVKLRFVDSEGEEEGGGGSCGTSGKSGGGCGTGACGTGSATDNVTDRVLEIDGGYLLELPVEAVRSPVVLTATLARAAGGIVLAEAGEEVAASELGGMSELAAIASGLGVLVASGAHVYGKSCGGARVSRHTHLAVEEVTVALALFTAHHGIKPSVAKTNLETTQREAFVEAYDWVESNPAIVTQLRTRPEVLEAGMFTCEPTKGFFGKLMARRAASEEERAFSFAPARGRAS
jgi:hypothetical protein